MSIKIDTKYWEDYYTFWDDFVRSWFDERKGKQACAEYRSIAEGYGKCVKDLNFDELPTPYLRMSNQTIQAVIIQLNPGGSAKDKDCVSLDDTQSYSNIDIGKNGWLIKHFRDEAEVSYFRHINKWSCLNPDLRGHNPEVCGVRWWQGNDPAIVGGRMKWIRQIYNKEITPESVFALELCPYHSVSFGGLQNGDAYKKVVLPFIKNHVIVPAVKAVLESNLDFAVAVGGQVARVLADLGANCEREWTYENDAGRWPKNAKNERVKRKYKLFNLKGEDGTSARFLVTWIASGGVGIPAPSERFKDIENEIRTNIANNSFGVGVAGCGKNQEGSGKTRKKPLKGCEVNPENAAFWGAFKKWCRDNGREWCTANVATRGNPYYEPEGRRQPLHLFFTIKKQGKLLVTIGIYCHRGEQQRQAIRGYKNEFRGISATQDWESGSGKAKRICFIRMVDWQNPSPELFRQMADDYEAVRGVLRRHGEL